MYPLREQKSRVCIQFLRAYAGIRDAETQSPGMLRKPGDLPQVCPRPKKFKRLATRDTLHGSRPNLQQREPDGRIVPTPPDVWDKGASTKRCARRKKKNHNYTYTYALPENRTLLCTQRVRVPLHYSYEYAMVYVPLGFSYFLGRALVAPGSTTVLAGLVASTLHPKK